MQTGQARTLTITGSTMGLLLGVGLVIWTVVLLAAPIESSAQHGADMAFGGVILRELQTAVTLPLALLGAAVATLSAVGYSGRRGVLLAAAVLTCIVASACLITFLSDDGPGGALALFTVGGGLASALLFMASSRARAQPAVSPP